MYQRAPCWVRVRSHSAAQVVRDGEEKLIQSSDVCRGDVVVLATFGGAGLTPFDETWRLTVDGETATWSRLDNLGTPPAPRVAASLNKLPSGDFLLHGGWTPKGDKETFAESHVLDLGM